MTTEILVELGAIYVRHFRALQHDVHDMLSGKTRADWDPAELVSIQQRLTANTSRMIPATDQVLNYVHQRTIQRLTLEALRTAEADTTPGSAASASPTPTRTDRARGQVSMPQMRAALPPVMSCRSSSGSWPIVSSMTLREYGQSLPWCG